MNQLKENGILCLRIFLAAWIASRIVLIGHEYIGHGLLSELLGAKINGIGLTLFGGGWVTYSHPGDWNLTKGIIVELGGIVFQIMLGALLCYQASRLTSEFVRFTFMATAGVCFIHGFSYLSFGTFYKFGDGELLGEALGNLSQFVSFFLLIAVALSSYIFTSICLSRAYSIFTGNFVTQSASIIVSGFFIFLAFISLAYLEIRLFPMARPPVIPFYASQGNKIAASIGRSVPSEFTDFIYKGALITTSLGCCLIAGCTQILWRRRLAKARAESI